MRSPTKETVWYPLLLEESTTMKQWTTERFVEYSIEYAVGTVSPGLLKGRLAREGWGASILTFLKDISFDCLSLAVRFNPDPFLPLFPWPNAATFPGVRSERYLRAQRQTFLGLDDLRAWIRSRSERDAKSLLLARYMPWQLRRVLSTIPAVDREFRTGSTTLGALSAEDVADLLVERWAALTLAHEEVKSTHLLSVEQLARLRRRSAETTARLRTVPNPLRRQWVRTRKGLLRLRARDAALREGGDGTPQERQSRIFATLMSLHLRLRPTRCPHCNVVLFWVVQYGIPPGEPKLIDPHVVSVDAITPRAHGGRYTRDNIAFVCRSCNTAKGHGSVEALRPLLRAIKNHALPGSGSFLGVQQPLSETLAPHDAGYVRAWAERQHLQVRDRMARDPRKVGDLTFQDIFQLGCARYLGQGKYRDPSGLSLPLAAASLDSLDPRGTYSRQNVRLLHTVFNRIRMDAPDDCPIKQVIAHLKAADLDDVDASGGMLGTEHFANRRAQDAGEERKWSADIFEIEVGLHFDEDAEHELQEALEADELNGDQEEGKQSRGGRSSRGG